MTEALTERNGWLFEIGGELTLEWRRFSVFEMSKYDQVDVIQSPTAALMPTGLLRLATRDSARLVSCQVGTSFLFNKSFD